MQSNFTCNDHLELLNNFDARSFIKKQSLIQILLSLDELIETGDTSPI